MSAKEARLKKIKDEAIDTANHDEVKHVVDVSSELDPSRGKVPVIKHSQCNWFVCLFVWCACVCTHVCVFVFYKNRCLYSSLNTSLCTTVLSVGFSPLYGAVSSFEI